MTTEDAKRCLKRGNEYPYDSPDEGSATAAVDWAHAAARGIMADLCDRGGIKHELSALDEDLRREVVESMSNIIRAAATPTGR